MINIPFDQYQRYKTAADIVEKNREYDRPFKILEVGANAHRNLEKFLINDDVTYIDIDFPDNLNDKNMIKGDATEMAFEDNTFDIIIGLDVYEHIPNERRNSFIDELNRVSKIGFIIGAPFNCEKTHEAEVRVNALYKSLYGKDYVWLKEHIQNVLPDMDETVKYLNERGIEYQLMYHGDIRIWEKLISLNFLGTRKEMMHEYEQQINSFYNKYIYPIDFFDSPEEVYRCFIIGGKLSKENQTPNYDDINIKKQRQNNYNELINLINNYMEILNLECSIGNDTAEYIEVFCDNENIKVEILVEEIANKKYIEKFIPLRGNKIERGLRIDPCNKCALLYIESIFLQEEPYIEEAQYCTTATYQINKYFNFTKDDPQIQILNAIGKELTGIIIRFKVIEYSYSNISLSDYIGKIVQAAIIEEKEYREKHQVSSNQILDSIRLQLEQKDKDLRKKDEELRKKDEDLRRKDEDLRIQKDYLTQKDNRVNELTSELNKNLHQLHYQIEEENQLKSQMDVLNNKIEGMYEKIRELDNQYQREIQKVSEKDSVIEQLQDEIIQNNSIINQIKAMNLFKLILWRWNRRK